MLSSTKNEPFQQDRERHNGHLLFITLSAALVIGFVFLASAKYYLFPTLTTVNAGTLTLAFGLMLSGPAIFAIKKERKQYESLTTPTQEIQQTPDSMEQETIFRLLFNSMTEGMALYRAVFNKHNVLVNFQLMDVNDAWIRIMGENPTDHIGTFLTDLHGFIEPAHLGIFRCVAITGEPQVFRHYRASSQKNIRVAVSSLHEGWIATTVEELPALEENNHHLTSPSLTHQTESVNALAGGMAHSINNLLTTILGNTQFALQTLSPSSPACPMLEEISCASQRVADLCNKLLRYAGNGQFQMEPLCLNAFIEELRPMQESNIPTTVSLHYLLSDSLPRISADRTELQQVIDGLVANATEAIGDLVGTIIIATGVIPCKRRYLHDAWLGNEVSEGEYVYLEVRDTGSGMNHETLKRIFDPFYSTKFMGRGLGLAAILGIVRTHRGAIKVHSQIGKGTTIRILLPPC